jgi:hypothetical protein
MEVNEEDERAEYEALLASGEKIARSVTKNPEDVKDLGVYGVGQVFYERQEHPDRLRPGAGFAAAQRGEILRSNLHERALAKPSPAYGLAARERAPVRVHRRCEEEAVWAAAKHGGHASQGVALASRTSINSLPEESNQGSDGRSASIRLTPSERLSSRARSTPRTARGAPPR